MDSEGSEPDPDYIPEKESESDSDDYSDSYLEKKPSPKKRRSARAKKSPVRHKAIGTEQSTPGKHVSVTVEKKPRVRHKSVSTDDEFISDGERNMRKKPQSIVGRISPRKTRSRRSPGSKDTRSKSESRKSPKRTVRKSRRDIRKSARRITSINESKRSKSESRKVVRRSSPRSGVRKSPIRDSKRIRSAERKPRSVNRKPHSIERKSPVYGQKSPSVKRKSPTVKRKSPSIEKKSLTKDTNSSKKDKRKSSRSDSGRSKSDERKATRSVAKKAKTNVTESYRVEKRRSKSDNKRLKSHGRKSRGTRRKPRNATGISSRSTSRSSRSSSRGSRSGIRRSRSGIRRSRSGSRGPRSGRRRSRSGSRGSRSGRRRSRSSSRGSRSGRRRSRSGSRGSRSSRRRSRSGSRGSRSRSRSRSGSRLSSRSSSRRSKSAERKLRGNIRKSQRRSRSPGSKSPIRHKSVNTGDIYPNKYKTLHSIQKSPVKSVAVNTRPQSILRLSPRDTDHKSPVKGVSIKRRTTRSSARMSPQRKSPLIHKSGYSSERKKKSVKASDASQKDLMKDESLNDDSHSLSRPESNDNNVYKDDHLESENMSETWRQRRKKSSNKNTPLKPTDEEISESPLEKSSVDEKVVRIGSRVCFCVGFVLMVFMGYKYALYCNVLHENQLWFTNIKEVEREISFRTESGLYYSYYKQLVNDPSLSSALYNLTHDKLTEHTTTMNVLARMNIYQEVVLGMMYRVLKGFRARMEPIYFYLYSIYGLQGLQLSVLYAIAWALSGTWMAGALTAAFFVANKDDTTRAAYISPLRENFSLPFLWCQLACITFYFMPSKGWKLRKVLCKSMLFLSTFLFAITWQFNQFILLMQSMALFGVQVLDLIPHKKILFVYMCQLGALVLVCLLQFFNVMILTGPLFCFVPAAIIIMRLQGKGHTGCGPGVVRALNVLWYIVLLFVISGLFALVARGLCQQDSDAHIFRFLLVKFGLAKSSRDFDVRLYLCNGAFGFLTADIIDRMTNYLVFPLYLVCHFALIIMMIIGLQQKWRQEYEYEESKKTDSPMTTNPSSVKYMLSNRPQLYYHTIQTFFFAVLGIVVTRMKYLWTPYMCIFGALCIGDYGLWKWIASKFHVKNTISVKVLQSFVLFFTLATLWNRALPAYNAEMENLREFYDPDTVELMEWIKKETPPTAAFSGSMQLLAGVKLCTGRPITNHPHYEDSHLRARTKQLYQMYARQDPETIHTILKQYGASYIILEDSICMANKKPDGCGLPSIMDFNNGEVPDYLENAEGLVKSKKPRFCDEIRYFRPSYMQFFRSVFKNRTFRVYQVLS